MKTVGSKDEGLEVDKDKVEDLDKVDDDDEDQEEAGGDT